jgi:hypothetical protein
VIIKKLDLVYVWIHFNIPAGLGLKGGTPIIFLDLTAIIPEI